MMVISHNLLAMNTQRMFKATTSEKQKSSEKLSSGFKINRAADDAAGLTISENMRRKIRGLNQAADNVQDGISYCNVAEGALAEISDMLLRLEEMSVKAANGTNTFADRDALDKEFQQLVTEMDRVFKSTEFNTLKIWPPTLMPMTSGYAEDYSLYKVKDASGEYYGGINYMGHNYSWADLGVGFDYNTHKFTEGTEYTINSSILAKSNATSSTLDDYNVNNGYNTASFTLTTKAGGDSGSIVKNYSWKADDSKGILIDGVLSDSATWASLGLTHGQEVKAGDYQFDYYGQTIYFEVPEAMDWDDFVNGIGNPRVEVVWTSTSSPGAREKIDDITSNVNRINIDNKNYSIIENNYDVEADNDKLWITNNKGWKSDEIAWSDLVTDKDTASVKNSFGSWGTDVSGNGSSKSDTVNKGDDNAGSSALAISDKLTYKYITDDFGTTNIGTNIFEFDFKLKEDQSKTDILQDIESLAYSQTGIYSPTKGVSAAGASTAEIRVSSATTNLSFYTQRDQLGREYTSDTEKVATGQLDDSGTNYNVVLSGVNGGRYTLTSTQNIDTFLNTQTSNILSKSENLRQTILNYQNSYESSERISRLNTWMSSSSNYFDTLANNNGNSYVNSIVTSSNIKGSMLSDADCSAIFGAAFDNNLVDGAGNPISPADKDTLKNTLWASETSANKITKWASVSATTKDSIWGTLTANGTITAAKIAGNVDNAAIDANIISFTDTEKETKYNSIRDSYINSSLLGATSMTFNNSGDRINLTLDMSNIKLDDIYNIYKSDGYLSYANRSKSLVNLNGNTQPIKDKVKKDMTDMRFDINGDGPSYQTIKFSQSHYNEGTEVINSPIVNSAFVEIDIQSGAEGDQQTPIRYHHMRSANLGLKNVHINEDYLARNALSRIANAQSIVSSERSQFGAFVNGFEHCYDNINNTVENTQAAESIIRDTDMATEAVNQAKLNILQQAVISLLTQANQSTQGVLSLLQ